MRKTGSLFGSAVANVKLIMLTRQAQDKHREHSTNRDRFLFFSSVKGDRLASYREWFVGAVALILSRLTPRAVAVFYQSDGRHEGAEIKCRSF